MPNDRQPNVLALDEAAEMLHLPAVAVEALVGSGYLVPSSVGASGPEFPLSDLKAFLARNAENGAGIEILTRALGSRPAAPSKDASFDGADAGPPELDPQELLDALDGRTAEMARRAFQIFATVFPEADRWTLREQTAFIEQAKGRFEALLAVTSQGSEVDAALFEDLRAVGAEAARSGSPLPQLLVILQISRDLVVQTAIELSETGGRHAGLALSLVLTRILPAMDRLTDALAQGYWEATLGREEEALSRYRHVVERTSDGVYEADLDGRIGFANPAFAVMVGRRLSGLVGSRLTEVLRPADQRQDLDELLSASPHSPGVTVAILRADGVRRLLAIQPTARYENGQPVGYQGIVRDETVEADLEADRAEFAALLRNDLRGPLATIVGLGATLESHGTELSPVHVASVGRSIRTQIERVSRLADDLSDISQLQTSRLRLYPRPVEVRPIVETALATVNIPGAPIPGAPDSNPPGPVRVGVSVDIPKGITALADPRRLEQIIANLVENAFQHGKPPVSIRSAVTGDEVRVIVADRGAGVPDEFVGALFSGRPTPTRLQYARTRHNGLGLTLVRGLAEAMGGRVWYEHDAETRFVLAVPAPLRGT
ncbi:MAG TPA: ATP-binding protein [Acidimicrobiales bacterium]|nr:ATP-binding protein [Acidimicrobiales bacterium]